MGRISEDAITIAQVLQSAGYRTFMSGKWHLGTNDPTKHGFEEYFGTLASAQTYWDPKHFIRKPQVARYAIIKKESFMGQMQSLIMRLTFFRKVVKHLINRGFYTWLTILLTFLCKHPSLRLRNMPKPINQVGIKSGNNDPRK